MLADFGLIYYARKSTKNHVSFVIFSKGRSVDRKQNSPGRDRSQAAYVIMLARAYAGTGNCAQSSATCWRVACCRSVFCGSRSI